MFQNSLSFAQTLDETDPLKSFRSRFLFPKTNGKDAIYFCGNSLGLQPVDLRKYIEQELQDWAQLGVDGHVHAKNPWVSYHKIVTASAAKTVGALPSEVIVMNSLTVNLHLLMVSFYRPTKQRFKIIMEAGAFSSDMYAIESQVRFHGLDPDKTIIELQPREKEFTIRHEDILKTIEENKKDLALVMIGGVNYYTGQAFDIKGITTAAHKAGALAGFDLAHAAGNIHLDLHDWKADFAVWSTYKYLNSGPGAVGGAFIHEKHIRRKDLPRFAGWWGHQEKERFLMKKGFRPTPSAEGWQVSNAPVLSMAAHKASLDIFDEAGIKQIIHKSQKLTGYMEYLIGIECKVPSAEERKNNPELYNIKIITPKEIDQRGCQLSILVRKNSKELFENLKREGFIVDWRSPNVIRVAPVPLYNTFEEVYKFSNLLAKTCCHE
ncbi:MAG TPA: kynureninase [Cytophagaceae bacterium]|jgi:kynureninase|nr:kynureninase [Cytophagaceae bacterium]